MESNLQNNDKEIHLLQSQLDQVEKDRSCLLAAVALVSGVLIPQLARQAELVSIENMMYGNLEKSRRDEVTSVFLSPAEKSGLPYVL